MREPQLVEKCALYPAACVDGRNEECVDTFYEPDHYGRVYLSRPMVRDSARLFPGLVRELALEQGYVPQSEHEAIIHHLTSQLEAAQRDVAALERTSLRTLRALGEERANIELEEVR